MSKVSLTRFLYYSDEVKISFVDALLRKKKKNEVMFWISEYYDSGLETESWILLLKIYNDFYALKNNLMKKIKQYYNLWLKNKEIKYILSIIKNLYYMNPNPEIFILYNLNAHIFDETSKLSEKKYNKLKNLSKLDINFINSLENKDKLRIHYYLKAYKHKDKDEENKNIEKCKKIIKLFTNKTYNYDTFGDIFQYIFVILIKYINNDSKIKKKFIKINVNESKMIKILNAKIMPVYKTLKYKRHYHISSWTNCFKLNIEIKTLKRNELLWYHWQYFAYETPLWKNRFQKYNGIKNNETMEVEFGDDSDNENFHDLFGYEPDEQNFETQEKSLLKYPNGSTYEWIKSIFDLNLENYNIIKTERCVCY